MNYPHTVSRPDYIPQIDWDEGAIPAEYLIIGCEWLEEDTLRLSGFEYRVIPPGFCELEANVSYVSPTKIVL